mmetsp:Transcript_41331/g.79043  ORF Transcript_41331/g.79043 Transcript_41331/m.79043 type:complete len:102 (-) Transcript_41331:62-367(-)
MGWSHWKLWVQLQYQRFQECDECLPGRSRNNDFTNVPYNVANRCAHLSNNLPHGRANIAHNLSHHRGTNCSPANFMWRVYEVGLHNIWYLHNQCEGWLRSP